MWEDGSGGNPRDGERWGEADEASLAHPPLTSCCVAWGLGTTAVEDNTTSKVGLQPRSGPQVQNFCPSPSWLFKNKTLLYICVYNIIFQFLYTTVCSLPKVYFPFTTIQVTCSPQPFSSGNQYSVLCIYMLILMWFGLFIYLFFIFLYSTYEGN